MSTVHPVMAADSWLVHNLEECQDDDARPALNTLLAATSRASGVWRTTPGSGQRAATPASSRLWDTKHMHHSTRVKQRTRLMQKSGDCNITLVNVPRQSAKYFSDIFTTVVDVKWRWCMFTFACSYLVSWVLFTALFYMAAYAHGDLELQDDHWLPCVMNGNTLLSLFLFSVESQSTIGYGARYPTEECPIVIATMCAQNIFGCLLQTLMVFAKLARPKKRAGTIMFSREAVINLHEGKLTLQFRVGDMRKSQLSEAHVRLQVIKKYQTAEGEKLPFHQFDMDVGYDCGADRVLVMWPIVISHEINEESPLYDISRESLSHSRFEIIAILEGVAESTGSTVQARTSYLPSEILWGHRFQKLVSYARYNGEYHIDYGLFHATYPVSCPPYSAKTLDEMKEDGGDTSSEIAGGLQLPSRNVLIHNDISEQSSLHSVGLPGVH